METGDRHDGVRNLLWFYNAASDWQRSAADWYWEAQAQCFARADHLDVDRKTFVWMVAALSPSCRWSKNIKAAEEIVRFGKTGYSYPINREKALRIYETGDLSILTGDKVTRFAESIWDPETTASTVVVDIWATRAWLGQWWGMLPAPRGIAYEMIEHDYKQAAKQVGLWPGSFQAIIWTVVRDMARSHGTPMLPIDSPQ